MGKTSLLYSVCAVFDVDSELVIKDSMPSLEKWVKLLYCIYSVCAALYNCNEMYWQLNMNFHY